LKKPNVSAGRYGKICTYDHLRLDIDCGQKGSQREVWDGLNSTPRNPAWLSYLSETVVAVCRHGAVYFLADRAERRLQAFLIGRMVEWQAKQVARAETLLDRPGQKMREMLAVRRLPRRLHWVLWLLSEIDGSMPPADFTRSSL
jgi:hypothetical protein